MKGKAKVKLVKQIIWKKCAIKDCRNFQYISKDTYLDKTYRKFIEKYGYETLRTLKN